MGGDDICRTKLWPSLLKMSPSHMTFSFQFHKLEEKGRHKSHFPGAQCAQPVFVRFSVSTRVHTIAWHI